MCGTQALTRGRRQEGVAVRFLGLQTLHLTSCLQAVVVPKPKSSFALKTACLCNTPPLCFPIHIHTCRPWWCPSSSRPSWAGSWRVRAVHALPLAAGCSCCF